MPRGSLNDRLVSLRGPDSIVAPNPWPAAVPARQITRLKALSLLAALLLTGCHGTNAVAAQSPAVEPGDCTIATQSVMIGRGTLAYNTAGTGPALLLLHGLFAAKEQWNALLCLLADAGYTAIAVDLPGYGKSAGYTLPDYRLDRQAQLLREFTYRLGIARLDIAGSSMGGAIATLYADRYRQQVRSLAFIGAPLGVTGWGPDLRAALYHGINPFIPVDDHQFELELHLLFVSPPTLPDAEQAAIVADYVARNRHYVQVWDIVNLYDDLLQQPPLPQLPALILWGTADRIYPVDAADTLRRSLPGSELHKLPEAGHLLLMENARQAASLYLAFLRSKPGRALR